MAEVNFDVEEASNYEITVPAGKYLVRCDDVREGTTKAGDERWNLTLTITHGEHKGNQIYDSIFFTENAMPRIKLICSRLGGIKGSGYVTIEPSELLDKSCYVAVEERADDFNEGKTIKRVSYAGYYAIATDDSSTEKKEKKNEKKTKPEDDLPF